MPKTGTTSLQNFCYQNRRKLLKDGYSYPSKPKHLNYHEPWLTKNRRHDFLLDSYRKGFLDRVLEYLIDVSGDKTIILSDEAVYYQFFCSDGKFFEHVKNFFISKGYTLKVCVYLRRQDVWIESFYRQCVKAKFLTGYIGFPEKFYAFIEKERGMLDYQKNIMGFKALYPEIELSVRIFERNLLVGHDITSDFFSGLLNIERYKKLDDLQITWGAKNVVLEDTAYRLGLRGDSLKRVRQPFEEDDKSISSLPLDIHHNILEKYVPSNIELCQELGLDVNSRLCSAKPVFKSSARTEKFSSE
jgi:hypothetical protein